jgi:hypothetical protein
MGRRGVAAVGGRGSESGLGPAMFCGAEKGGGPVSEYPTVICEVVAP